VDLIANPWNELFGVTSGEWGVLAIRVALGYIFFDSGLGKWRRGISKTGAWFQSLGFPVPQQAARLVATLELVGGILLMFGFAVHWVAIPLVVNMVVATYVQKFKLRAPFQGGDVQGYELDVLMIFTAVCLVISGSGPFSIDAALG